MDNIQAVDVEPNKDPVVLLPEGLVPPNKVAVDPPGVPNALLPCAAVPKPTSHE